MSKCIDSYIRGTEPSKFHRHHQMSSSFPTLALEVSLPPPSRSLCLSLAPSPSSAQTLIQPRRDSAQFAATREKRSFHPASKRLSVFRYLTSNSFLSRSEYDPHQVRNGLVLPTRFRQVPAWSPGQALMPLISGV